MNHYHDIVLLVFDKRYSLNTGYDRIIYMYRYIVPVFLIGCLLLYGMFFFVFLFS